MGGIRGRHFFGNHIYENTIENNSLFGIRILNESANNVIEHNNFRNNRPLDAFFTISSTSLSNTWDSNYWSRSRTLPKLILGYLRQNKSSTIGILWFTFDYNPADEPYNI